MDTARHVAYQQTAGTSPNSLHPATPSAAETVDIAKAPQSEKAEVSVRASGADGEKHARPLTANPGQPNATPKATAPVFTSAQATETGATGKATESDAPKTGATAQEPASRIVCRSSRELFELRKSLKQGKCGASQITVAPYAPTDSEMKRLIKALRAAGNQVNELVIVVSNLREEGFEQLADFVNNDCPLRKLSITDGNGRAVRSWQGLADALAANRTLEDLEIEFSSQVEGKEGRKSIYASLSGNVSLKKVTFAGAGMDTESSTVLAQSLRANPRLKQLRLLHMPFNAGSQHPLLMEAIGSHPGLENLMLNAPLEQSDAVVLMTALKTSTTLKTLELQSVPQGESAEPFANAAQDMLRHNHTLEELRISGHGLTDKDVEKLANALCENRGLLRLLLWPSILPFGSALSQASVHAMTRMLDHNKLIQQIDIEFHERLENDRWSVSSEDHPANQELRAKLEKNRASQ